VFNPDVLWAFDSANPIRASYDRSLAAAQGGRFDNDSKRLRFYVLHQLVERAVERFPNADLAECGCWWGHSAHLTASILERRRARGRLAVFDSFEGLSPFSEADSSAFHDSPERQAAARQHFAADFTTVHALLSPFSFVSLYRGWIPSRFPDVEDWSFSHVFIDVDLYQPTRDALAFFYSRLLPGGTVFVDDYGYQDFPGARRAVDEALPSLSPAFFLEFPSGGAVLVK